MRLKLSLMIVLLFNLGLSGSHSQTITELGFFSPLISSFDMKYLNNHLFVTQQGLKIFDVSNAANPVQTGNAPYPGSYAYQIAVDDSFAYLAEGGNGAFTVYDISNVNSPTQTGTVYIPSTSFVTGGDLLVAGSTAYLTGADSLYMIDVSNVNLPQFITSMQVVNTSFGSADALAVNGNTLFVNHSLGIGVYDITNSFNPTLLTTISKTHAYHRGLATDTILDRLFSPWLNASQTYTGFDAYDISNPQNPIFLFADSTSFGGGEFGFTDYNNNLLIISASGSVNLFDVSYLTHGFLTEFSGQNVPNATVSLEFRDSVFYNMRGGGFEILQVNGGFPVSINERNNSDVTISPNPCLSNKYLTITSGKKINNIQYQLFSSEGTLITEGVTIGGTILPGNISPGVYLLKVRAENDLMLKKIIIL